MIEEERTKVRSRKRRYSKQQEERFLLQSRFGKNKDCEREAKLVLRRGLSELGHVQGNGAGRELQLWGHERRRRGWHVDVSISESLNPKGFKQKTVFSM